MLEQQLQTNPFWQTLQLPEEPTTTTVTTATATAAAAATSAASV